MFKRIAFLMFFLVFSVAYAEGLLLKPGHPYRYVVQPGDTLWKISKIFLNEPWRWRELLGLNPQIGDPDLIYPGDVLALKQVNGSPRLYVATRGPINLSPKVRTKRLDKAILAVPYDAIQPFLSSDLVVQEGELEAAPYILAVAGEHVTGNPGDLLYVRGFVTADTRNFSIYRKGVPYVDHKSHELLGYQAKYIGDVQLHVASDPSSFYMTKGKHAALRGDRLLPFPVNPVDTHFYPQPPKRPIDAEIISVMGGVTQIGQYNVVVIDRGKVDGMVPGEVLGIYHNGADVLDPVEGQRTFVTLPYVKAGELMVFRTFDRISFALVMAATEPLHVKDRVANP